MTDLPVGATGWLGMAADLPGLCSGRGVSVATAVGRDEDMGGSVDLATSSASQSWCRIMESQFMSLEHGEHDAQHHLCLEVETASFPPVVL